MRQDIIKNYNKALYKRCPKCHQVLKLPLKKGAHTVKCPECGNSFTVNNSDISDFINF